MSGKLKPHHTGANGYRYYSHQQLNDLLGISDIQRKVVGYCRVSSNKQKDDLIRQVENMEKYLLSLNGCEIEVLDNTEKTEQQELVEDSLQIVTVFSCKLQGKRANKAKKMVKELTEIDKDN